VFALGVSRLMMTGGGAGKVTGTVADAGWATETDEDAVVVALCVVLLGVGVGVWPL